MIGSLGVCSWSLRAESPAALAESARACGVDAVQLALEPIRSGRWGLGDTRRALEDAGVRILSAMFEPVGEDYTTLETIRETGGLRPDATWGENRARAEACAALAADLGVDLVTYHAGFFPDDPGDPERATLLARLGEITDIFAARSVRTALETGQETAENLSRVLDELGRNDLGVNFDPANMILYGSGDPIAALDRLLPRVVQVHLKDAVAPESPGVWGTEVPVGRGEVDWAAFGRLIAGHPSTLDMALEREAGDQRVDDVRAGREHLAALGVFAGLNDG